MNLKRLAKRALATLSLSMLCLVAFAQGHQISGTVIDGTVNQLSVQTYWK